jgi:hypothetical protein
MAVGVEVRASALDDPRDVGLRGAQSPVLSALRPRPDRPEWDTAVWFDILTFPGTPAANEFYRDLERWMFTVWSGAYAAPRAEWSKGRAYTAAGAYADRRLIRRVIPATYRAGRRRGDDWDWATAMLKRADPHEVFSNPLLGDLFR